MAEAKEVGLRLGLRLGERARFGVGLSRRTEAPLPLRRRVTVWSGEVERLPFALCVGDRGIVDRTIGDRGIDDRIIRRNFRGLDRCGRGPCVTGDYIKPDQVITVEHDRTAVRAPF